MPAPVTAGAPAGPGGRITGLEGLRGLAALYVVVHHCWLLCFPGYPADNGPAWLGWLLYGRLAVVVFIVLSGYSLGIAPARNGWRLGGLWRYLGRRARRILPPYWAALAVSLAIAAVTGPPPTGRSILVYGLLLQDVVRAPAPNGAFWSIAVEVGLYLVFPLLLVLRRRTRAAVTLAVVGVPAIATALWWPGSLGPGKAIGYTWELAPLFTIGLLAAGDRSRRPPWRTLSVLAAVPVLVLILRNGSGWTVQHYFWIDLAVGPAIAAFLVAVSVGRPPRLLTTRPVCRLGRVSYSLYLIHVPVVALVSRRLVAPHVAAGLPAFWATLILAVPASVAAATVFAAIFEKPFRPRTPGKATVPPACT